MLSQFSYLLELHGDEPESLLLEPLDDVADESALDGIGLDHDEGALVVSHADVCGGGAGD